MPERQCSSFNTTMHITVSPYVYISLHIIALCISQCCSAGQIEDINHYTMCLYLSVITLKSDRCSPPSLSHIKPTRFWDTFPPKKLLVQNI